MDLIIWTSQSVKDYDVKIADTVLKIPVVLIDNTVTLGWESYATFDHFYPGGWTSTDTLYCITKDYNLASEKFRVSYLTHETQHLFDARSYSGCSGWLAEYRAKLAELASAETTACNLIRSFINGQRMDSRLPHPYAEYRLIKDLSKEIFQENFVTDTLKWFKVPFKQINLASGKLLQQNSSTLTKKHSGI